MISVQFSLCTTCDPCATSEHTETTRQVIKLIMENSNLHVRVLSKSIKILDLAEALYEWKDPHHLWIVQLAHPVLK